MFSNKSNKLLIVLLLFFSCNSNVLLSDFDLKKEKSFYAGLDEITIYELKNTKTEILRKLDIESHPKHKNSQLFSNWQKVNISDEISSNLVSELKISLQTTKSNESVFWVKSFLTSFESNQNRYLISGLSRAFKLNEVESINHFYYCCIIDLKEKKLFEFDFAL